MGLVVKPIKSSTQDSGCLTVNVADGTGAYNSTSNTGGYGSPNPAYTDIASIVLRVFRPNETSYEDLTLTGATTPTAVQYANPSGGYYYPLNSINTGQDTTSVALTDGAYTVQEFVCYADGDPMVEASVTNGSNTVNISSGFTYYSDFNYILLPDGKFYEVASIDVNAGIVTLVNNYAGETTSSTSFSYVFSGTGYIYVYCSADKCMTSLLADQFVADVQKGCCSEHINETAEHAFYEFYILKADEANDDFATFNTNIAVYTDKYCDGSTGGCGCGCS